MVTKPYADMPLATQSSVIAKILMVTKPKISVSNAIIGSVLAKILMVTKPQKYGSTFLNVIEY